MRVGSTAVGSQEARHERIAVASLVLALAAGCRATVAAARAPELQKGAFAMTYPEARRGDVADDYHGTTVRDPYRWLEDPDSEETRAWVEAENRVTEAFLAGAPAREPIRERLTRLWDYERFGVPFKEGGRTFYSHNPGLLNQARFYVIDAPGAEPRLLLDPNLLSEDGTVAVSGLSVSPDGKHLAYALSSSGSDWMTWHVRDVASGEDLADEIPWSKFSGASWARDGAGFYYGAYDPPKGDGGKHTEANYYQKLYFHRLGAPAAEDRLVYERPDHKQWGFSGRSPRTAATW